MAVTIKKDVLYSFLEKLIENRTPSDGDIDKFAYDDEPISPIAMMSTQLAHEEPDVGNPDYRPASIPGLSDAAAVIAREVPPAQIDFFYNKLHRLLDVVLDREYENEMQNEALLREASERIMNRILARSVNKILANQSSLGAEVTALSTHGAFAEVSPVTIRQNLENLLGPQRIPSQQSQPEIEIQALELSDDDIDRLLTTTTESIMSDIAQYYLSHVNKYRELKKMGIEEQELQQYKDELGFIFDESQDANQRRQNILELVQYSIAHDSTIQTRFNDLVNETGYRPETLKLTLSQKLNADPGFMTAGSISKMSPDEDLDLAMVQYANQLFDTVLASVEIPRNKKKTLTQAQQEEIQSATNETIAKLVATPEIDISSIRKGAAKGPMIISTAALADRLAAIVSDHIGEEELDLKWEEESDDIEVEDVEEDEQVKEPTWDEAKTFKDMASFLGFSGASGARQWYRKHIESKYLLLLKVHQDPASAGPGLKAMYDTYSDTYKSVLSQMKNLLGRFESQYHLEPGSTNEQAMNQLTSDLTRLADLTEPQQHILDPSPDDEAIVKIMNSRVGKAVAIANSIPMKQITTYIMDKAAPAIANDVVKELYPHVDDAQIKKLQEHISGKSNRPDYTDPAKQTTQKFLQLGIDEKGYRAIVSKFMEELDVLLQSVLLSDEKAVSLYGDRATAVKKKFPEISSVFKKVFKKVNLKEVDILDMLEEALIDYSTDLTIQSQQNTPELQEAKTTMLSEIIKKCL